MDNYKVSSARFESMACRQTLPALFETLCKVGTGLYRSYSMASLWMICSAGPSPNPNANNWRTKHTSFLKLQSKAIVQWSVIPNQWSSWNRSYIIWWLFSGKWYHSMKLLRVLIQWILTHIGRMIFKHKSNFLACNIWWTFKYKWDYKKKDFLDYKLADRCKI